MVKISITPAQKSVTRITFLKVKRGNIVLARKNYENKGLPLQRDDGYCFREVNKQVFCL